jgi:alpha-mannosidase
MFFLSERIDTILKELKTLILTDKYQLNDVVKKDGYYHDIESANASDEPFVPFDAAHLWGGDDTFAWFRASFKVPEDMQGRRLIFTLETGNEGWDATNPQFLVFINGVLMQGFDVNHKETPMCESAKAGDEYIFDLQAYGGKSAHNSTVKLAQCIMSVCVLDADAQKLYYDIKVPHDAAKLLPKEDKNRIYIEQHLEKAINLLDLRRVGSDEYMASVKAACHYLEEEFYSKYCGDLSVVANCVGHTHIDVAWLWDLAQTRQKVQRSFSTVLKLMEQYPDYIFMSSQPQLYKYLKEERPELYEKVKEAIASGRWEAEGAMWVEADCNISSGESLVRQIIHGKRFFREEFGVDNKIVWLPDVFGYSDALPQIFKKSGVDYFMTTKISWNEYNKMPYDTFKWVGLDGSEVLTHFITTKDYKSVPYSHSTTYNGYINASEVMGSWERYQQKDINNEVLISFGYGDGGGGPTKDQLEMHKRLKRGIPGVPATKMSTAIDFFESLDERVGDDPMLPRWVGELYLEFHRGTLTTMARNKRYNRKSEFLYEEAEWLSAAANIISGTEYPKQTIKDAWETICLNQFHDIIPGSSIKKVYEDSKEQYEAIIAEGNEIKSNALTAIASDISAEKVSVAVFNPAPFERDEIVDVDYEGKNLSFVARGIPAKGYKIFTLDDIRESKSSVNATKDTLENEFLKVKFDDKANIVSVYDKVNGRELIKEGRSANVLQAFEDKPYQYDAWEISIYYQHKMWEIDDVQSVEVMDLGPHRAGIKVTRKFLESTITQVISLDEGKQNIDFDTTIDWKERQVLLKTLFPVDVHTEKATYDVQFGNVERPTHWNTSWDMAKFEVCGHKWADLSEGGYGVSLLNDCKYGYDIKEGEMRLTLLKSAVSPNEDADREVHHFTYSLYPHADGWKQADTVKLGYEVNQPVTAIVIPSQKGSLPGELSIANVDCDNVVMEVIKQAEESSDIIIRVHECKNTRVNATLTFFKEIESVTECDLEERGDICEYEADGNKVSFTIMPYEIKTFRLKV